MIESGIIGGIDVVMIRLDTDRWAIDVVRHTSDDTKEHVEGWETDTEEKACSLYDERVLHYQNLEKIVTPKEALLICKAGGCVWLKDWAEENYGSEDDPHYDYPTEDPEDIKTWIEEGLFVEPNPVIILSEPWRSD